MFLFSASSLTQSRNFFLSSSWVLSPHCCYFWPRLFSVGRVFSSWILQRGPRGPSLTPRAKALPVVLSCGLLPFQHHDKLLEYHCLNSITFPEATKYEVPLRLILLFRMFYPFEKYFPWQLPSCNSCFANWTVTFESHPHILVDMRSLFHCGCGVSRVNHLEISFVGLSSYWVIIFIVHARLQESKICTDRTAFGSKGVSCILVNSDLVVFLAFPKQIVTIDITVVAFSLRKHCFYVRCEDILSLSESKNWFPQVSAAGLVPWRVCHSATLLYIWLLRCIPVWPIRTCVGW